LRRECHGSRLQSQELVTEHQPPSPFALHVASF
jgi:hypothetical protein